MPLVSTIRLKNAMRSLLPLEKRFLCEEHPGVKRTFNNLRLVESKQREYYE